jgi:hypothetical protein
MPSEVSKRLLAISLGAALSLGLACSVEVFFRLNKEHRWINPPGPVGLPREPLDNGASRTIRRRMGAGPEDGWSHPLQGKKSNLGQTRVVKYWGALPLLGQECKDLVRATSRTSATHETLYDVTYGFDGHCRRQVPNNRGRKRTKVVLAGCSFTFGEGVSDGQTVANQLAALRKDTAVYSISLPGFGPGDVLRELQERGTRTEGLGPPGGVGVFLLIDAHLERTICKSFCVQDRFAWVLQQRPYYRLDARGDPVYAGTFRDSAPWKWRWYRLVFGSAFLEFVGLPRVSWTGEDFRLMAGLLAQIEKEMLAKAAIDRFFVVFYPGSSNYLAQNLREPLTKLGVRFLDYSRLDLDVLTDGHGFFPVDGHPSPRSYFALAWLLDRDLPD